MNVHGSGTPRASRSTDYAHENPGCDVVARDDTELVDSIVASSWHRCVNQYNFDRANHGGPEILTTNEFKRAADPLDLLMHVAKPEIERLMSQVGDMSYVIMLSDSNGVALDVRSSMPLDKGMRRAGVCAGAAWAEEHAGTNGIGTSIAHGTAVTIHRSQHFFLNYSNLSCIATPIFDSAGNVVAALDASSLIDLPREMQRFVLELLTTTARRVERRYFLERNRDRTILRIESGLVRGGDGDGIMLALDDNGCMIECNGGNGRDTRMLDRTRLLGRPLSAIMEIDWQDVGIDHKDTHVERIGIARLNDDERPCFASLTAPKRLAGARPAKAASAPRSKIQSLPKSSALDLETLAGRDLTMQEHAQTIRRLVDTRLPVLLQGETGTGKEEFAHAIHNVSARAAKPFVVIDCSSIPESLIESELFGYETGTFTGARREGRRGRIAEANGGTLFLDEIGDMPLALQTRLLRVLAQGEIMPLGGAKPVKVDFSLICATHQDLHLMVSEGKFRRDLYFRIAGIRLELPPLRKRTDKADVIEGALAIEAALMSLDAPPRLSPSTLALLASQPWPGNMRELRLAMRYALAVSGGGEITEERLPNWLDFDASDETDEAACEEPATPTLIEVLERNRWVISDAANELSVSRQTLYRWIKKQNLNRPK
ncbi:sigma-54-dependent Fis family transcriptional regulator [uncultured Hyphomicrobium sp.]|jgi:transcriptional regulator of acetoin/glycerol metabolism|uniref:sigma-54-dependent Fis family transcriptional regulator n=1 Tax=uncultured Hyphomicrobium sp. TaxID=194373 RepID=UPI0025ECB9B0|nr:sigma-54-dependent Fis family transcriptional regulator [uncultured Hyphomicrobium sp.]